MFPVRIKTCLNNTRQRFPARIFAITGLAWTGRAVALVTSFFDDDAGCSPDLHPVWGCDRHPSAVSGSTSNSSGSILY